MESAVRSSLAAASRVSEQHFPGRGKINLFHRPFPPLGNKVKAVDAVHLVAPKLQAVGLLHVGRVNIHNAAAHRKLARAVHLEAALIPRAEQPLDEHVHGDSHALLHRESVAAEFLFGRCVLQHGLHGRARDARAAAHQVAQHGKAPVLVFMALAFHGAQHIIPRGEYLGPPAEHGGVLRKARGIGLARAHHQRRNGPYPRTVRPASGRGPWAAYRTGPPQRASRPPCPPAAVCIQVFVSGEQSA